MTTEDQTSPTPQDSKKENDMASSEILNQLNALATDGEGGGRPRHS